MIWEKMLRKTKNSMQQSREATNVPPTNVQSNVSHFMQIIMHNHNDALMQILGKYCFQKQPPELIYYKRCFKNFPKFTRKYLYWILFLKTPPQVFSCKFCEIFKNRSFVEPLWTADFELFKNLFLVSSWNSGFDNSHS